MNPVADSTRQLPESCDVRFLRWERNVALLFALLSTLSATVSAMNASYVEEKLDRLRNQPVHAACEVVAERQ